MEDVSVKESCNNKYESITTSTPYKSIHDSGYYTPSSTISSASSNLHQISEVSISFNHSPSDPDIDLQLSSAVHNLTQNCNENTLGDISNTVDSHNYFYTSPYVRQELSPSKKFKLSSDLRLRFRTINKSLKDNDSLFLKRKSPIPTKTNIHERNSLEGREKVDFIFFLSERHHFELVTEKIFSFLSGSDIISISMVSKTWCNAVENSQIAQKKKRTYFKLSKENRCDYDGRDRSAFHNKGYLTNISNVMRSPSKKDMPQRSPPVSPSKYRFHVFQKVSITISVPTLFKILYTLFTSYFI